MNFPGGWELVLILIVVMVVFGAKRLPDSARALGKSLRILKAETKGLRDDETATTTSTAAVEEERPRFDPYTGEPLKPPAAPEQPHA